MKGKKKILPTIAGVFSLTLPLSSLMTLLVPVHGGHAEEGVKGQLLTSEGVSNSVDKHRRGPTLSLSTETFSDRAKILVDTAISNEEYQQYPVKVEFFINRTLYETQWRSQELPGSLGIEVPFTKVPAPFNFTVVATLIHPNRQFPSVIQGAVFPNEFATTLPCTFTLTQGEEVITYTASSVSFTQSGAQAIGFSTTAVDTESAELSFTGSLSLGELTSGTRTVTGTITQGETITQVTGSAGENDKKITELSASSSDGSLKLECEAIAVEEGASSSEDTSSSSESSSSEPESLDKYAIDNPDNDSSLTEEAADRVTGQDNVTDE